MVDAGNQFALATRDSVVGNAQNSSILVAYNHGNRLGAAFSCCFIGRVFDVTSLCLALSWIRFLHRTFFV